MGFPTNSELSHLDDTHEMTIKEIHELQALIDQSNRGRATELSMAEKFKLGADLYDDGIRWLKQIIKAEQPDLGDEQINQELVKRRVEEAGRFRLYLEDALIGNE